MQIKNLNKIFIFKINIILYSLILILLNFLISYYYINLLIFIITFSIFTLLFKNILKNMNYNNS